MNSTYIPNYNVDQLQLPGQHIRTPQEFFAASRRHKLESQPQPQASQRLRNHRNLLDDPLKLLLPFMLAGFFVAGICSFYVVLSVACAIVSAI
jgi:hypothetical protein